MIASRTQKGLLWTHNDHGDVARIFAMSEEGEDFGTDLIIERLYEYFVTFVYNFPTKHASLVSIIENIHHFRYMGS